MCAIGAYTVHNSMFDVWMMLVFGVIGYVFNKLSYPLAPLVLAIVLGDKAEEGFRQALLGSQGGLGSVLFQLAGRIDHGARHRATVLAGDRLDEKQAKGLANSIALLLTCYRRTSVAEPTAAGGTPLKSNPQEEETRASGPCPNYGVHST